jgi:hypothetical protein
MSRCCNVIGALDSSEVSPLGGLRPNFLSDGTGLAVLLILDGQALEVVHVGARTHACLGRLSGLAPADPIEVGGLIKCVVP